MEARDLMIGDWVSYEGKEFIIDASSLLYIDEISVKPIPLTTEIMKANGFSEEIRGCDCRGKWQKIIGINAITVGERNLEYKCIHNFSWTFKLLGIQLKYVHELQHALRLCGFNEMANNFKLKCSKNESL